MTTINEENYEDILSSWIEDIEEGETDTVSKGEKFAFKIFQDWLGLSEDDLADLYHCDGAGDGGIDIAYLDPYTEDMPEDAGSTWYVVQSKYKGRRDYIHKDEVKRELEKMINTLRRPKKSKLNEEAKQFLEKFDNFIANKSDKDKIVFVYATSVDPPIEEMENLQGIFDDIIAIASASLHSNVDVKLVTPRIVLHPNYQEASLEISGQFVLSNDMLFGRIPLENLYNFMQNYKEQTKDIDLLYDYNVRLFVGKTRINEGIEKTLNENPENLDKFNNGITIVVDDIQPESKDNFVLMNPRIVNGCQTTKTIWTVFDTKKQHGGTGKVVDDDWQAKVASAGIIAKIIKTSEKDTLENIIRFTNSQNTVNGKDFLALEDNFRLLWSERMKRDYGVFLEIRRGDWLRLESQQKGKENRIKKHVKAFDLLKIYGSGWLGLPGSSWAHNNLFEPPDGELYTEIVASDQFDHSDLYAAFVLKQEADSENFGQRAKVWSRRLTRFLFYRVFVALLTTSIEKYTGNEVDKTTITNAILQLDKENSLEPLSNLSSKTVDKYMDDSEEWSMYNEIEFDDDPNKFLKDKKFGDKNNPDYNKMLFTQIHFYSEVFSFSESLHDQSPNDKLIKLLIDGGVIS